MAAPTKPEPRTPRWSLPILVGLGLVLNAVGFLLGVARPRITQLLDDLRGR